jgi:hypothetical protein
MGTDTVDIPPQFLSAFPYLKWLTVSNNQITRFPLRPWNTALAHHMGGQASRRPMGRTSDQAKTRFRP